jgi:rare lipoprotein A
MMLTRQHTIGRRPLAILVVVFAICVSACARRVPTAAPSAPARILEIREGLASYYGQDFHGKIMASGSPFDMNAMIAAHPRYPFGTLLRVTNLTNGRSVMVRIQDRGPARQPQREGVIIDLSRSAAERLGFIQQGRVRVRLQVVEWGRTESVPKRTKLR